MTEYKPWPNAPPVISPEDLTLCYDQKEQFCEVTQSFDDIVQKSTAFPIPFGADTVKCHALHARGVEKEILEHNINSAYPILHEAALTLVIQFLKHKKTCGSNVEKEFYKNFTVFKLIDRLLLTRAVVFYGRFDKCLLPDGSRCTGKWEKIGTDQESPPRILADCLSYDEIKLSALLSVSSFTCFINDGNRHNKGKCDVNKDRLEESGIIIGLIGPRFSKPGVMEYQETIVTSTSTEKRVSKNKKIKLSNTSGVDSSITDMFINFYEEPKLIYDECRDHTQFTKLADNKYFNNNIYQKRLTLSFDTLLLEANERASETNKMAYVHVVGIGLGVWRASSHQNNIFMMTFCERLKFLGKKLNNVSDVCFAYIRADSCDYKDHDLLSIQGHPNGGVRIHIEDRNPHSKLTGPHGGKLLVVSYAWDGNALPGNEFWIGKLASSGDPAAACSTQIAELHNPHINRNVSAKNLRIATMNGIETFLDYLNKFKSNNIEHLK